MSRLMSRLLAWVDRRLPQNWRCKRGQHVWGQVRGAYGKEYLGCGNCRATVDTPMRTKR